MSSLVLTLNKYSIESNVMIIHNSKEYVVHALWDTGSNSTVISDELCKELQLSPVGNVKKTSANSSELDNKYKVDVGIPEIETLFTVEVTTSKMIHSHNIDVLIGMDIITKGNFYIQHDSDKLIFTFEYQQ